MKCDSEAELQQGFAILTQRRSTAAFPRLLRGFSRVVGVIKAIAGRLQAG